MEIPSKPCTVWVTNLVPANHVLVRRPRLRTLLLGVNLVIVLLPLAGIGVLRVYESALVRQTESELIAQGAFVAAAYRAAFERRVVPQQAERYGLPLLIAPAPVSGPYGSTSYRALLPDSESPEPNRWQPRPAKLDLSTDRVWPPVPPATAGRPADRYALAVGREITTLMREAQLVTLAAIRVVDPQGTVVASTGEELGASLVEREEVKRALAGDHTSLLRARVADEMDAKGEHEPRVKGVRVVVATPVVHRERVLGAVVLARTPSKLTQVLYRHRTPLVIGLGVIIGVALVVSLFTALAIARPVSAVTQQALRARRGERGAVTPLTHPVTREIAQLSEAVAAMAQSLEARAEYIRNFATHVSHEFKTPLTAMQGAVELLRDHAADMTEGERNRFLANLAADVERLDRLVRRLLDLARADMSSHTDESAELQAALLPVIDGYRAQGLQIDLAGTLPATAVPLSRETLEAIFGNLFNNARQHVGPQVRLTISAEGHDDWAGVRIADNGPGISVANAARVFDPFFTTARNQGGTGLGLPIVKALLEAHGGSIELLPGQPGAVFLIKLPVK